MMNLGDFILVLILSSSRGRGRPSFAVALVQINDVVRITIDIEHAFTPHCDLRYNIYLERSESSIIDGLSSSRR